MFVYLSKIIPIFLYPVGLGSLLLIAALAMREPRWRKRALILAIFIFWVAGNRWFSNALVRSLEWQILPPQEIPAVDMIVILGGGTYPAEYPRQTVEVQDAGDRVLYGAKLFRDGIAPLLLVTGGSVPWSTAEAPGAKNMSDLLEFLGVPADAILVETESVNTYENGVFTREILEPMGINRIVLVTSAMHMPRSVKIFENLGFEVIPAPTDFMITRSAVQKPLSEIWPDLLFSLIPRSENLHKTTLALKEYLGIFTYWLRGWV